MATHEMDTGEMSKEKRASLRKSNKPIMEKRRRARINSCLTQLKSLVLEAMRKDSSQYSKLEKADILEMTVRHLRTLQRQQMNNALSSDPNIVTKYRAGFNECAGEVFRYLTNSQCITDGARTKIVNHLSQVLQNVNSETPSSPNRCQQTVTAVPQIPQTVTASLPQTTPLVQPLSVQIPQQTSTNNNFGQFSSLSSSDSSISSLQQQTTCLLMPGNTQQSINSTSPTLLNIATTPVKIDNNNQKFTGSFQIVPGNMYNGPVAVYVGQVNEQSPPTTTAMPVFAVQVPQHNNNNVNSSPINRNKENLYSKESNNNHESYIKSKQSQILNVANMNYQDSGVYSDSLWRPW